METKNQVSLGILGDGQLAQMLVQNCPYTDLEIKVLTENPQSPVSSTTATLVSGSPSNPQDVKSFVESVDFVTFENEFLDMEPFLDLRKQFPRKIFFPQIPVLKTVQNKLLQKYLFQRLELPTAPFEAFEPQFQKLGDWIHHLEQTFPQGCMIKWAQGGYDGKGNFVYSDSSAKKDLIDFCQMAQDKKVGLYAEPLVEFDKEVAMVYSQNLRMEFINFPLVITEQSHNICHLIYGPATEFDVPQSLEDQAAEMGRILADEFGYVGTFALEFFLTKDKKLLINEMAPRVHNSGHYTLDACDMNQFSCHLKSGFGSSLQPPTSFPFFAMLNLLGREPHDNLPPPPEASPDLPYKVYWYHKKQSSLGRKLGHINTVATSKSELDANIKKMRAFESDYWASLNRK